jgi:hypothetical protein
MMMSNRHARLGNSTRWNNLTHRAGRHGLAILSCISGGADEERERQCGRRDGPFRLRFPPSQHVPSFVYWPSGELFWRRSEVLRWQTHTLSSFRLEDDNVPCAVLLYMCLLELCFPTQLGRCTFLMSASTELRKIVHQYPVKGTASHHIASLRVR